MLKNITISWDKYLIYQYMSLLLKFSTGSGSKLLGSCNPKWHWGPQSSERYTGLECLKLLMYGWLSKIYPSYWVPDLSLSQCYCIPPICFPVTNQCVRHESFPSDLPNMLRLMMFSSMCQWNPCSLIVILYLKTTYIRLTRYF